MFVNPTRTNLLLLKERASSITSSVELLKARRNALMKEFLKTTVSFIRSRDEVRGIYKRAIDELTISKCYEGEIGIASLTCATKRDVNIDLVEKKIWGLRYKDVSINDGQIREPHKRGYDIRFTDPHVEECIYHFERLLESMLKVAEYECKLKRLGDEITTLTRRINVIEERILKELKEQAKGIALYIAEREREAYYRLKRFLISRASGNSQYIDTPCA